MGANISHFNLLGKCTLFQDTEVIQIQKIELFQQIAKKNQRQSSLKYKERGVEKTSLDVIQAGYQSDKEIFTSACELYDTNPAIYSY